MPPGTTREKFVAKLYDMEDDAKNPVKNVTDDSSNSEIKIEVKFNRGYCKDWDEDDAINFFKLYKKDTQRLVLVDWSNDRIKTYNSTEEYMLDFIEHRFTFYVKRYENLLAKTNKTLIHWKLIKACYDEDLPSDLTNMNSKTDLTNAIKAIDLKHSCGADKEEVDKIAALPTYRWVRDNYSDVLEKISSLEDDIEYYTNLLDDHDLIWEIYKEEVQELKNTKFSTGRE